MSLTLNGSRDFAVLSVYSTVVLVIALFLQLICRPVFSAG